jgi:prepilin-type N-terminal cleavage/methylation domain-containing protein
MKTKQTGFTLVEIAIVLVIVGLLLGGILKGQEMIVQAKVKNSITDFSGISAAYFGYQDRYRAIPGDDIGAGRWTTPTVATAGNGDRILTGLYVPALATNETALWWDHLRRSGFVTGSGVANPQNSFAGTIGVQQGDGTGTGATAAAAVLGGFTNLIMCSSNLPDKVAIALDVQMDDGNANSGAVRATDATGVAPAVSTAATMSTSGYVETGTTIYTLCRQF